MTIGERIALYRKQKLMTQEMLANELGVSNQAVSKWESNQNYPDIQLLVGLADIFGISMDNLFGREEKSIKENDISENSIKDLPWEDDNTLRAVVYVGHKLYEYKKFREAENVVFNYEGIPFNIKSCFSVRCQDVSGNISAGGSVECGDVAGDVISEGSVSCGDICGNVSAGGSVECGDVCGKISVGDSVECGDINGKIQQ